MHAARTQFALEDEQAGHISGAETGRACLLVIEEFLNADGSEGCCIESAAVADIADRKFNMVKHCRPLCGASVLGNHTGRTCGAQP